VDPDLRVRFRGDAEALVRELERAGFAVNVTGPAELRLTGVAPRAARGVFRAARGAGAVVLELRPGRTSLEDAFMQAVGKERSLAHP